MSHDSWVEGNEILPRRFITLRIEWSYWVTVRPILCFITWITRIFNVCNSRPSAEGPVNSYLTLRTHVYLLSVDISTIEIVSHCKRCGHLVGAVDLTSRYCTVVIVAGPSIIKGPAPANNRSSCSCIRSGLATVKFDYRACTLKAGRCRICFSSRWTGYNDWFHSRVVRTLVVPRFKRDEFRHTVTVCVFYDSWRPSYICITSPIAIIPAVVGKGPTWCNC